MRKSDTMEGVMFVSAAVRATGKIDVDAKDKLGWTPRSWARRHKAVVQLLLTTSKVDVNAKNEGGSTVVDASDCAG